MDYSCFQNKVVVITAAGGEIGSATALAMAGYGASLAIIDIHEERLNQAVAALKRAGVTSKRLYSVVGDCTDEATVNSFIDNTVAKFNKIDILVNVTGTKRMKSLDTCTLDDLEYCMVGNFKSLYLIVKKTAPHLIKSQGSMVNMSSISGQRPAWAALPYCSIKAGCDQFIRCIATELGIKGVRVNAVSPAAMRTDYQLRFGDIFTSRDQLDRYMEIADHSIPMGRTGTVEEVCNVILYLASDKAPMINGAIVPVCGAYSNTVYNPK